MREIAIISLFLYLYTNRKERKENAGKSFYIKNQFCFDFFSFLFCFYEN